MSILPEVCQWATRNPFTAELGVNVPNPMSRATDSWALSTPPQVDPRNSQRRSLYYSRDISGTLRTTLPTRITARPLYQLMRYTHRPVLTEFVPHYLRGYL